LSFTIERFTPLKEDIDFLIVGTVRNVAKGIRSEILHLNKIFAQLGKFEFFFVESDSTDNTVEILQGLKTENVNLDFISLGDLRTTHPDRVTRLQFCRNHYLIYLQEELILREIKYLIVVDLDGINTLLNSKTIAQSLRRNESWSAIFANQSGPYYDILALRHPIWCQRNSFCDLEKLTPIFGYAKAKKLTVYDKMIKVDKSSPMIPVISAFGGFGIYRAHILKDHDYTPTVNDEPGDIDHVVLNRKLSSVGEKLFIDPQLVNGAWNHHNVMSIRLLRELNYLIRKYNLTLMRKILRPIHRFVTKHV